MQKPYYQDSAVTIYHGDCREIVPQLGRFDLLLTDPPYGMNYKPERKRKPKGKWFVSNKEAVFDDDKDFDAVPFLPLSNKHVFWGANWFSGSLPKSGGWLIWDKRRQGTVNPEFIASDCELAWSNLLGRTKIFSHLWAGLTRDSEIGRHYHPTQKPIALMSWCITLAGDVQTVLDPFMGSGTTLRAAKDLNRQAIGIELEEKYCEIAASRMSQEVLAL